MAVYEHLPNQEVFLKDAAARLADGGALLLQTPTAGIPRLVGSTALRHNPPGSRLIPR